MLAIVSLLIILSLSLMITRIATVALTLTGLSRQSARFQARSAFTGVGFTTTEAEKVVGHPLRRRILMILMILGNAGIVTAVASMMMTFVGDNEISWMWRLIWLIAGLVLFWVVAMSEWLDHRLSPVIAWALKRWGKLDVRDYAAVLHLGGDYGVMELQVEKKDWLAGKTLVELDLPHEGVLVLGIRRKDGKYIGAPKGETRINPHDTLTVYGRSPVLSDLDQRRDDRSGDIAHHKLVEEQKQVIEEEQIEDPAHPKEEAETAASAQKA